MENSGSNTKRSARGILPWFISGTILAWVITHKISFHLICAVYMGSEAVGAMNLVFQFSAIITLVSAIVVYLLWKSQKRHLYILFSILVGTVFGLILIISSRPLLRFVNTPDFLFPMAFDALRGCAFALPVVTLSMSLGCLLLARGKRTQYIIIKVVGVILFFSIAYVCVLRFGLGVWSILPAVLISEMAAVILSGIFVSKAGKTAGIIENEFAKTGNAPEIEDSHLNHASLSETAPPPSGRRFCGACGAEATGGNAFCPVCGSRLADQLQGSGHMPPHGAAPGYGRPLYGQDAPNAGFAVLGFFFPVIGLILYLVWREPLPLRAKSAGKGAIIGVIVYVALVIIVVIAQVALLNSFFGLY